LSETAAEETMPGPTRADLFAEIWRVLEKENAATLRTAYDEFRRNSAASEAQLEELASTVAAGVDQAEEGLDSWARDQGGGGPFSLVARYVIAARALERWYDPLVAFGDRYRLPAAGRQEAWKSLVSRGRLNDNPELGSVILKRPKWGRWRDPLWGGSPRDEFRDVADFFGTLHLAPPTVEAGGPDDEKDPDEQRKIPLAYRMLQEDLLMADPRCEDDVLVVGFAPLAERLGDITVNLPPPQGSRRSYDVVAQDLSDRAAAAMEKLVGAGANVVVFPEMAIAPATLTVIKDAASKLGAEPKSPLRLVVAGSTRVGEGGLPCNEAVLFNHRGEQIGRQRKLHRWNLDSDLRHIYDLRPDGGMRREDLLYEYIEPGDEMCILESPRLGRLAVLICESLGRTRPGMWILENMRLDWLFTPVLDRSLEQWRWIGQAGFQATRAGRCRVVVANSMALTLFANNVANALRAKGQVVPKALLGYPVHDVGVGLCIDVLDGEQSARCRVVNLRVPGERVDDGNAAWEAVPWKVDAFPIIDLRRPAQVANPPSLFGRLVGRSAGTQAVPELVPGPDAA
jgi:hypothetical protein